MANKVSVIIPTHNRASVIGRAVASVRAQTFHDMEIIVVDDGSTDDTPQIVQSIHDPRIRYIRCQTNRGPSAARNVGLKAARGEYVAFLDSDDEWAPEKTEKQVRLLDSLSDDWGYCSTGTRFIKDGWRESHLCPTPVRQGYTFADLLFGKLYVPTPGLVIRRACLKRVGFFDERLRVNEDYELLIRLSREYRLAVLPEPLVVVHRDTTKLRADSIEPACLLILQKHTSSVRGELGWYAARRFRAQAFWRIADQKLRNREWAAGLSYWLRAITSTPLMSPKRYLMIALACLGLLPLAKKLRWGGDPTSRQRRRQENGPLSATEANGQAEPSSETRAA
jgi:glycosyltransferase involved in cell wall biosynthesis